MKLVRFRVQNYRNILDSGLIDVGSVTAFVGQNEAGKSNLFEALHCLNPITPEGYKADEDWPVDQWGVRETANGTEVCSAEFALSEEEIRDVFAFAAPSALPLSDKPEGSSEPAPPASSTLPTAATVIARRAYGEETVRHLHADGEDKLDSAKVTQWLAQRLPKFVLVREYDMSGEQVELDQLQQRLISSGNNRQSPCIHQA
jgi:predicted ATP-dependent endonuclease of OLD family